MVKVDCELRNVRLDLELAGHLPAVVVDEIQIQQVLLNLLRNALDAMEMPCPDGDRALASKRRSPRRRRSRCAWQIAACGIADSDLESVFEPFFSTKSSGLGIGLSISRKIIEAHGGTLACARPTQGVARCSSSPSRLPPRRD